MNISYFICGCVRVSADYENVTSLLNLCMYYCIPYTDFTACADRVTMVFRLSEFKKMRKEAEERGIIYTVEKRWGLPAVLERYKYRHGIIVGVLCAVFLIFVSQQFVWDIDVVGNESVTSAEVRNMLKEHGFGVGTFIGTTNTDRIENKILIDTDKISWISINIVGTVAEVQIRENRKAQASPTVTKPANLIAAKSGVIQEVRIYRGNVVVGAGKYVEKGDLLVSGLFDSERVGFRYTRAAGEVWAKTTNEFYIEIPYEYEENEYTGVEYYDKYLTFFDYSINISKNSGKEEGFYDKIDIVENFSLADGTRTPFEIRTVKYLQYERITKRRTAQQAEELAYFELSQRLDQMADSSTVIRKTVTPSVKDDRFVLYCVVVSVEDIAQVSEFEVELETKDAQ